jgi:hypothetical protein
MTRGFVAGSLSTVAAISLWQDSLGLDAYLSVVRDGWAPASITVPVALALLAAAAWIVWPREV